MSDRPSIAMIIEAWHALYDETHHGERGTPYLRIAASRMQEALDSLANTLNENKFSYSEMRSSAVYGPMVNSVWRENKIAKMSPTEIRKKKETLIEDWFLAIAKYSGVVIAAPSAPKKIAESTKKETKKETKPEKDPPKGINLDTSDMMETPLDLEFLQELGISPEEMGDE